MRVSINDGVTEKIEELAESLHYEYETSKGVSCEYKKFHIIAEENDEIVGILIGYTAFSEIYVEDLVVHKNFRNQGVGRMLLQKLEKHFEGKNYSNINLVTNEFQASDFYKKCGYTLEFVRRNKKFPLLSKYFFIKWLS